MDSDKKITENDTTKPVESDLSDLTDDEPVKTQAVPSVDVNAPLEIEQIRKPSTGIPETNLKAPLKIEEEEEKEENGQQEKSSKKLFIFGGIILAVIVLLTVGFFAFSAREAQKEEKAAQVATERATPSPTQAPKKTLDKSEWSMEVLNGSGVSGAAKKIADQLKDLGYPIVKTGNADNSSYETSQILVKKELQDKIDLVLADIKDIVKIASASGELKDSTASARIILGKQ